VTQTQLSGETRIFTTFPIKYNTTTWERWEVCACLQV